MKYELQVSLKQLGVYTAIAYVFHSLIELLLRMHRVPQRAAVTHILVVLCHISRQAHRVTQALALSNC
jgi:hypothetical protein